MLLGIDLGTSQVKALLTTADGQVIGRTTAGYPVSAPRPGWAETDPRRWWRAVAEAVRALPARAEVRALAIAGQMHGAVLSTERGTPLRPALLWLDSRATTEAAEFPVLENEPSPGMAGPMALWLSRHEPEVFAAARWLLPPKDWLRFQLTGAAATDPSDASGTLLFDLGRDTWLADVAGLRSGLLPPVRPSGSLAGPLLPAPAAELGLPPGIPVAVGAADTAASLLAADLPSAEWALLTIGSGAQWIAPVPAGSPPSLRTNLFRDAGSGRYRLAPVQNAGLTLDWVRRLVGLSWDDLYALSATALGQEAPVFDPHLVPERWLGPGTGPGAGWTGVTLAHTRDDLIRSALLAVARLLSDGLADLRAAGSAPRQVLLSGGGTRHPAWRTLLAEVLALPLHEAPTPWLTAHGAARLAAAVAA